MEEKEIFVYDDLLPSSFYDTIENLTKFNPWKLVNPNAGTSGVSNEEVIKLGYNNIFEQFQFSTIILQDGNIEFDMENFAHTLLVIPNICMSLHGLYVNLKDVFRIKLNLQTRAFNNPNNYYNFPHIDLNPSLVDVDNSYTILYYVNDSDGDTVFFNENLPTFPEVTPEEINNLTICKRVSPKKGRIVLFRSNIYHAGTHPNKTDYREVINFNLRPIKLNFGEGKNKVIV